VVGEGADLDPAVLRRGLPFSDGTAQRVVFARCLGRAPDLVFTLSEAARVCAPGGEVVCQLGRDGDPRDLRVVTPAMLRWFAVPGRGGFALEEERADVVRLRCLKTTGPTPQVRRVDLGSGPTPRVGYVGNRCTDRCLIAS
jgi:SAM-dependent methyltransferase